jgi:glutamate-1-semialdehyde 2,1-aminomutase
MTDADGNEFVDYIGSWGPMILGHAHERVIESDSGNGFVGTSFGASNEREIDLAVLIKNSCRQSKSCEWSIPAPKRR